MIVGRPEGACVPELTLEANACVPESQWPFFERNGGKPFPAEHIKKAVEEIDELCYILEQEGVTVRRPDLTVNYEAGYETPDFKTPSGMYSAMPRYGEYVI